jgi:hypothetical protein
VFRRIADLDVQLDSLLRGSLTGTGFCLLHFRRLS